MVKRNSYLWFSSLPSTYILICLTKVPVCWRKYFLKSLRETLLGLKEDILSFKWCRQGTRFIFLPVYLDFKNRKNISISTNILENLVRVANFLLLGNVSISTNWINLLFVVFFSLFIYKLKNIDEEKNSFSSKFIQQLGIFIVFYCFLFLRASCEKWNYFLNKIINYFFFKYFFLGN
jgi:hypothetical protein